MPCLLVTTIVRTESQGWFQKRRILGDKINAKSQYLQSIKITGLKWIRNLKM